MRLAFYAPLKPPDHPIPSGDRRMARLLTEAWRRAGHDVELASRLIALDPLASPERQQEIETRAAAERERLMADFSSRTADGRPAAWFTYHVYYKAPDWLGPKVAEALSIPYLIAEASIAGKRAAGPYARGHAAAVDAVRAAQRIFIINPADRECLEPLVVGAERLVDLPAFLDTGSFARTPAERSAARRALTERYGLPANLPWMLAVGMMRPGDKLASYMILGQAVVRLLALDWRLLVVGDGTARSDVEAALAPLGRERVLFLGRLEEGEIARCFSAADLCLWPAVNEAYGMAMLEAQAAGLPVIAGAYGGVPSILQDQVTGLLAPPGDVAAFAAAVQALLEAPARRAAMGKAARENARCHHDIAGAAGILDRALSEVCRLDVGPSSVGAG